MWCAICRPTCLCCIWYQYHLCVWQSNCFHQCMYCFTTHFEFQTQFQLHCTQSIYALDNRNMEFCVQLFCHILKVTIMTVWIHRCSVYVLIRPQFLYASNMLALWDHKLCPVKYTLTTWSIFSDEANFSQPVIQ